MRYGIDLPRLIASFLLVTLWVGEGVAQPAVTFDEDDLVGHYRTGVAGAVDVQEDRLFYGSGRYFYIADISDPQRPVELAVADIGFVNEIQVAGDYVFALNGRRFFVLDVADPSGMEVIAELDVSGAGARGLAVQGTQAFALTTHGLYVLDIQDPHAPVLLDTYPIPFEVDADCNAPFPNDVAARGDLVYVAHDDGLEVLDASDPTDIRPLAFHADLIATSLVLQDTMAYLAYNTLCAVDLADPLRPVDQGCVELDVLADEIQLDETVAYIAADEVGLLTVNIETPGAFFVEDRAEQEYRVIPSDLALGPDVAYVSAWGGGIQIFDASSPDQLERLDVVETHDGIRDIEVNGSVAVLGAQTAGMVLLDISDPRTPTLSATMRLGFNVDQVAVRDEIVFASGVVGDVAIIDISDPARPLELGRIPIEISREVSISPGGDLLYIAGRGGLHIADVSSPTEPLPLGALTWCERWRNCAGEIALGDGAAYITDPHLDGLRVIDVRRPEQPTERAFLPMEDPNDVAASADHVYAITRTALYVYDARQPLRLSELAQVDLGLFGISNTSSFHLEGNLLYILGGQGIYVFDVSVPEAPELAATYDVGRLAEVTISEGYLYAAADTRGLLVYDAVGGTGLSSPTYPGPASLSLETYPNPAFTHVDYEYDLPATGEVLLRAYDLLGRQVATLIDATRPAGTHTAQWEVGGLPSGVYYLRLTTGGQTTTHQVTVAP